MLCYLLGCWLKVNERLCEAGFLGFSLSSSKYWHDYPVLVATVCFLCSPSGFFQLIRTSVKVTKLPFTITISLLPRQSKYFRLLRRQITWLTRWIFLYRQHDNLTFMPLCQTTRCHYSEGHLSTLNCHENLRYYYSLWIQSTWIRLVPYCKIKYVRVSVRIWTHSVTRKRNLISAVCILI
jgi:hypothetical protein